MRDTAWDRDELEAAAELVGRPGLEAYLLLALPLGELPAATVRRASARLAWRDAEVALRGDLLGEVITLVQAGTHPGDRFFDPAGMPWEWIRTVRSGTRQLALGFEVLLGGPAVSLHAELDASVAGMLAEAFAAGEISGPPAAVMLEDHELLLDGDARCWRLDPAAPDPAPSPLQLVPTPDRRIRRIAAQLGSCGLTDVEVLETDGGSYLVTGTLAQNPAWRADVPVRCSEGLTMVGVDPREIADILEPSTGFAPVGWSWVGTHAGDAVAVHTSGLWAYLHRRVGATTARTV